MILAMAGLLAMMLMLFGITMYWAYGKHQRLSEAKKYGAVPGDFKLQDRNGDFKFTNDDKVFLGSTIQSSAGRYVTISTSSKTLISPLCWYQALGS
jgi:hypothetical protein